MTSTLIALPSFGSSFEMRTGNLEGCGSRDVFCLAGTGLMDFVKLWIGSHSSQFAISSPFPAVLKEVVSLTSSALHLKALTCIFKQKFSNAASFSPAEKTIYQVIVYKYSLLA
jgi:hypothetical protein